MNQGRREPGEVGLGQGTILGGVYITNKQPQSLDEVLVHVLLLLVLPKFPSVEAISDS